jgi:putative CocE/NonD family hydrolase
MHRKSKVGKQQVLCVLWLTFLVTACSPPDKLIDIEVPMRDGVRLLTDVYLPDGEEPFPVILCRVPYGTKTDYVFQQQAGEYFSSKGFAYVTQNVRGRFGSEGEFTAYVHGQEIPDGYDTIEWIVAQDWSDGNIGVMGESYYGYTTLMAAVGGHPAVRAISPANITLAREKQSLDGSFPLQASGLWTLDMDDAVNGEYQDTSNIDLFHLPLITLGEVNGLRDVLWRERINGYSKSPKTLQQSAIEHYGKINVPTLHFGGWYDSFTRGTIALWEGIAEYGGPKAKQWLVLGPWDHDSMSVHISGTDPASHIGRRDIGRESATSYGTTLLQFFGHFLRGDDNGFDSRPAVSYFSIGDNSWRTADQWPVRGIEQKSLYLGLDSLDMAPETDSGSINYRYDPADPVTITADSNVWGRAAGLPDRSVVLGRNDVVIFETEALAEPLDITGPISLELFASSTAVDTDFTAALVDVYPDGYSLLIQEGILRASYRDKNAEPSPIEAGRVYTFEIDLWATSYIVPPGHKLRLEVSSSNFPRFMRNLNTGETFGTGERTEIAEQVIYFGGEYPSRLILPVLDAETAGN